MNNPEPLRIPDHELLKRIGSGSYGEVWLARNALGSYRAVKIVRRSTFDDERPFEREFEGLQKFEPISRSHPSQLSILHVGRGEGCFYYIMELADTAEPRVTSVQCSVFGNQSSVISDPCSVIGKSVPAAGAVTDSVNTDPLITEHWLLNTYAPRTLKLELKRRPRLPPSDCVHIGLALTTALAHLHQHGLVHRDIKPSNIIFVEGLPKLADIGLVTSLDATRSFVGTEGYLAPEGPGTPQADIYSLGKVLYEMSTGQDRCHFPVLPTDVAQLPEGQQLSELNAVVIKACQHDPLLRYQSAEAMQADLTLLRRGKSVKRQRTTERRTLLAKKLSIPTAACALLATGGWLLFTRFNDSTVQRFNASSPTGPPEANSIAVLPFINERKIPAHDYLCDALTDETMNALTNCAGLRVVPHAAVFAFKRATNDVRRIGEQLGVRTVLTGTFFRNSNGTHLTARLVNVADGAQLWSTSFDRGREEFDALAADVVQPAACALGLALEEEVLDRARTNLMRKLAAHKLYSQVLTNAWNTQNGLDHSIRLLNQAIAEEPNYAQAYAVLAYCYDEASGFYLPQAQAMEQAKVNALRALQLDDYLPFAHRALARVYCRHELNLAQAKVHFQRAIELVPNDGVGYGDYSWGLSHFGLFKEAEQVLKRGDQVDPKAHNLLGGWCWRYYLDRDFEKARQAAQRLQTSYPNGIMGTWFLALSYEGLRQYDEALTMTQKTVQHDPSPDGIAFLGRIHARLGHREEAQKALEELRVLSQSPRGALTFSAEIMVALGETNRALEHLQRAVDEYPPTVLSLKVHPFWDELRDDPRFQALLRKVEVEK